LRNFFCIIVLYNYCVSALSLYIELTDSMIRSKQHDYYSTPKKWCQHWEHFSKGAFAAQLCCKLEGFL